MSETQEIEVVEGGYLHLIGQFCEHAEARIVGTREALAALAATIEKALKDGAADTPMVFTNDGEGYHVEIAVVEGAAVDEIPLHYVSRHQSADAQYWMDRAFEAEAERSRLRRAAGIVNTKTATQGA